MNRSILIPLVFIACLAPALASAGTRDTRTFRRVKTPLDSIAAIDRHEHLWPLHKLPSYVETDKGKGMNLYSIWRNSYYTWNHPLTPWKDGQKFDDWWAKSKRDFDNARA